MCVYLFALSIQAHVQAHKMLSLGNDSLTMRPMFPRVTSDWNTASLTSNLRLIHERIAQRAVNPLPTAE